MTAAAEIVSTATTGMVLAEVYGKVYAAARPARFDIDVETTDHGCRVDIASRTAVLRCDCGESAEWPAHRGGHEWTCTRYYRTDGEDVDVTDNYLTIVRAVRLPCEHWTELPLTFGAAT